MQSMVIIRQEQLLGQLWGEGKKSTGALLIIAASSLTTIIMMTVPCNAQHVTNGLGDATVIQSATQSDPYGISEVNSAIAGDVMVTRHRRAFQSSGIGGSFMGTTSVTSETRPVGQATIVQPISTPALIHLGVQPQPGRRLFSQSMLVSPATAAVSNLPTFPEVSALDVLKFKTRPSSSELDMSVLMHKMDKHYNDMMNRYEGSWDNENRYGPFGN